MGLSALFLPELVEPIDTPGVSAYPEQPLVEDDEVARRTEKITYIFNAGGEFETPAVTIDWWNKDTAQIESATLPALAADGDRSAAADGITKEPAAARNWQPMLPH